MHFLSKCFDIWKLFCTFAAIFKSYNYLWRSKNPNLKCFIPKKLTRFFGKQTDKVRAKILYNIAKASYTNDPKLFKKLENTDIWEFRTLFDNIQYRLLAFWDKRNGQNTLVIATHGFIKKSQKTPKGEIEHAQSIKDIYFNQ